MAKTDTTAAARPAPAGSGDERLSEADILHRDLSTAVILFHEAVSRRLGLTAADRKCLAVLGELGEVTPGRLAQATGLSTGAVTGVVDRLEKAGYAARRPNPQDRRSLLVRPLAPPGMMETLIPIFGSLSASMAELAGRYTPDQLAVIHAYLAETTAVLKQETEKVERGAEAAE
jgi:hypothetical protein